MKTINDSLQANTALVAIHQTVRYLKKLTQLINLYLPTAVQHHCQVASYRDGLLVLQADNASWGTQLRYLLPELQRNLQALPEFNDIKNIRIYIQPLVRPVTTKYQPLQISSKSAQLILQIAEHTPGKLGAALKKLATRGIK